MSAQTAEGDLSLLLKGSSLCAGGASPTSPLDLNYHYICEVRLQSLCLTGDDHNIKGDRNRETQSSKSVCHHFEMSLIVN